MANKILRAQDNIILKDNHKIIRESAAQKGTNIMFFDENGKQYRTEHNNIVIAGAQLTACKHFDIDQAVVLPNYNTELGIENMSASPEQTNEEFAYLFCCGTSGCGAEASQIYPVDYHNRIDTKYLVPFRYEKKDADLDDAMRKVYYGRKEIGDRVAYYYKAFDSKPQVFLKFVDGTQIDSTIYNAPTSQQAYTMVEVRLKITKSDLRDWFFAQNDIGNARINTISLLTGWKYTDPNSGYDFYNNVRPLTQFNFTNEWLIDLSKTITIVYQIFY